MIVYVGINLDSGGPPRFKRENRRPVSNLKALNGQNNMIATSAFKRADNKFISFKKKLKEPVLIMNPFGDNTLSVRLSSARANRKTGTKKIQKNKSLHDSLNSLRDFIITLNCPQS